MLTNFYIDGFNLYKGCLEGGPHKWLDLVEFCRRSFPPPLNLLHKVHYFTARVRAWPHDPTQPERQAAYLRALTSRPEVTAHFGQFKTTRPWVKVVDRTTDGLHVWCPAGGYRHPLVTAAAHRPELVRVERAEEKGSDVNLATRLLLDAFKGDYEAAVVVTNDPDQKEAIRAVKEELKKRVGVLFPVRPGRPANNDLKKAASFHGVIDPALLALSHFPRSLTDGKGRPVHKPTGW